MIIPDGDDHKYVLIDSNIDEERGGILLDDFLKDIKNKGLIFINTHPHNDHTRGLKSIKELVKEIWHSGHKPGKEHDDSYKEMEGVMKDIGDKNVFYLRGTCDLNTVHTDREEKSKTVKKIGDVDFQVFSPAKYVCDDIAGEDPEARSRRIHEQCGVIKFTYKDKSILLTGDSDKTAWKESIKAYYEDNLKSEVLSASHHGSRSFFKDGEDDKDVYEEHIEAIGPEYLIISAPKQKDSLHDHPHDDALDLYKKHIEEGNIFHLGVKGESVVADIDSNGNLTISDEEIDKTSESDVIFRTSGASRPYFPNAN